MQTMFRIISILILLITLVNCKPVNSEKKESRETKAEEPKIKQVKELSFCELLQSKSKITGLQEFDLEKLNLNEENVNETNFKKVDSVFYTKYLFGNDEFTNTYTVNNSHKYAYKYLYFYSYMDNGPCNSIFLIDDCYDGSNSYKLLYINFDDNGKIISSFTLARDYYYPGGGIVEKSYFTNGAIIHYNITGNAKSYPEEKGRYYPEFDSVTTKYKINDNGLFEKLNYYDSVRYDTR